MKATTLTSSSTWTELNILGPNGVGTFVGDPFAHRDLFGTNSILTREQFPTANLGTEIFQAGTNLWGTKACDCHTSSVPLRVSGIGTLVRRDRSVAPHA